MLATNSRLDTLKAVVLRAKNRLAAWNEARSAAARCYDDLLADLRGMRSPGTMPGACACTRRYRLEEEGLGLVS